MQHLPAAWLLALLNGAVLLAAAGVAGVVLAGRARPPADAAEAWQSGVRELGREVRRAAEPEGTPADADRVARRLLPLAGRIRAHVRAAPASADAATYRRLHGLAVDCQAVALEPRGPTAVEGPFLEDRLAALRESARALEDAAA